jgi:hypothetical protein
MAKPRRGSTAPRSSEDTIVTIDSELQCSDCTCRDTSTTAVEVAASLTLLGDMLFNTPTHTHACALFAHASHSLTHHLNWGLCHALSRTHTHTHTHTHAHTPPSGTSGPTTLFTPWSSAVASTCPSTALATSLLASLQRAPVSLACSSPTLASPTLQSPHSSDARALPLRVPPLTYPPTHPHHHPTLAACVVPCAHDVNPLFALSYHRSMRSIQG